MDPWIVVPVERARHIEQFKALGPVGGFITGDQARGFLLQSGLPPPILAQIWGLADVNCDGKLDINEFSVACKLITMKLKGLEMPPSLPPSLRAVLNASGQTTPILSPQMGSGMATPPVAGVMSPPVMRMPGQQMGGMVAPTGVIPQQMVMPATGNSVPPTSLAFRSSTPPSGQGRSGSITSHDSIVSPLLEWAVPHPSRLKYTQLFNQNDRSKSGYLTGVQARNILLGTGLPQPILAQVWGLSDMDNDGRLGTEEFVLALHLCDVARQTGRLPTKLTPDLIPPSFRTGSRKQSLKGGTGTGGSLVGSGPNTGTNSPIVECELVMSPGGTTFEDKRKENFDKGQAELERRRKVLQDAQDRERHERERKEREDYERREKQRLEIERRQAEERERQLAMQKEMEERRMEELRKNEEQKDHARREMERQRRAEMDDNKRQELLARRQREQEEVLRMKGVNHGLGLEISQLTDKVKELSGKITETRQGVSTVKTEIDGMRTNRDTFMNEMGMRKGQLKDQNNRMLLAAQEKIRLEKLATESEAKQMNLKQLREKLQNMREELEKKESDTDVGVNECNELKNTLATLIESCKTIYSEFKTKRETVITNRKKHVQELDYNSAWGDTGKDLSRQGSLATNGDGLSYYRALYDFEGRNEDELTFNAGDIIQKNDSVVPDPGWLAGIFNSHSGWFPESFVECISAEEAAISTPAVSHVPLPVQQSVEVDGTIGEYYVAVYPYESHEPGDLAFETGETIFVTHKEGEWWTGQIGSDRVGIFPANYVQPPDHTTASTTSVPEAEVVSHEAHDGYSNTVSSTVTSTNYSEKMDTHVRDLGRRHDLEPFEEAEIKREISEIVKQPPQKSPKATKTKRYEIATVLANYQATSEGQLNLTRGQLITVRKKSPSGWWEGELQLKGKTRTIGWFPGSFIKVLGPGGGSRQSSSRTTPIPFDEYDMPITDAPMLHHSADTEITETIHGDSRRQVYSETKEQVIALYPYTAQNSDELSFIKDDVIIVISKDEPDWWRGQIGGSVGLFPTNYVQPMSNTQGQEDLQSPPSSRPISFGDSLPSQTSHKNGNDTWGESGFATFNFSQSSFSNGGADSNSNKSSSSIFEDSKRQDAIQELISTEETYMADMKIVKNCFMIPLFNSGLLNPDELQTIFINWDDLIDCSSRLLKAFIIRQRTCYSGVIQMIGDILCQHIPSFTIYIRFCSAQLRSAALLQNKCESSTEFKEYCKSLQGNPNTKSLPLSSFLIKPMQRITKYPLLVKKIMESTPDEHPDRQNLEEALIKAEELCAQVNEGVREKENSDRLEWMQSHIQCEGLEERLIFNSLTNQLGPRKFLHHGILHKTKSGKQIVGFLFNDFLLLAQPNKLLSTSFSFDRHKTMKFKIYRKPLFLNEIWIEESVSENENEFAVGIENNKGSWMYVTAPGISEKRLWLKSIREAKKRFLLTEQQYLQRQKSKKGVKAVGRLLVVVMEGENLADRDKSGKSDPYCEISLGSEIKRTKVIRGSLNPKWNDSMQFSVKDLAQDILCVTVYDKDYFSPNQFLGRTEIGIVSIFEETRNRKTPWTRKFPLHEVESGEIVIKLHLQLFEN
ncbi:intersectin-2 isoform X1 [Folsomia candida]|uniref:intersectin-2 isoform X1 n=1 Tax=Folsomia candida TaxID=158441 RepID=UPI000B8F1AE7|nr:intersectin-2 isoform X1 [Folsomia candida]